jgi:hypothetical protein
VAAAAQRRLSPVLESRRHRMFPPVITRGRATTPVLASSTACSSASTMCRCGSDRLEALTPKGCRRHQRAGASPGAASVRPPPPARRSRHARLYQQRLLTRSIGVHIQPLRSRLQSSACTRRSDNEAQLGRPWRILVQHGCMTATGRMVPVASKGSPVSTPIPRPAAPMHACSSSSPQTATALRISRPAPPP